MGFGDAIMATALMRGFHTQGKLAAFYSPDGNHRSIKWTGVCEDVFKYNPNVARPAQERESNLVWMPHYKKVHRYCDYNGVLRKYIWRADFKAEPGEIFFGPDDRVSAPVEQPYIVVEPNVAWQRATNVNKDWGDGKYEALTKALTERGHTVVQCVHPQSRRKLKSHHVWTPKFRDAMRIMSQARLVIAPEGANHHAAAALGVPAIILWGSWSPRKTMGYQEHTMLGTDDACGNVQSCPHCRAVFNRISIDEVVAAAERILH